MECWDLWYFCSLCLTVGLLSLSSVYSSAYHSGDWLWLLQTKGTSLSLSGLCLLWGRRAELTGHWTGKTLYSQPSLLQQVDLGNISTVGNISKRSQMTIQPGPAAPDTPNIANCKHLSVCFSHHLPPKPPLTPTKLQSSLDTFGCIVNVKDGKGTLGLITALAGPAALLLKFQLDGMKVFQCWISRKLSHNSLNLL